MSRKVNLVLHCEVSLHEAFLRRFLETMNWKVRRVRIERGLDGM